MSVYEIRGRDSSRLGQCRAIGRQLLYCALSILLTLILFVFGFFLGGSFSALPTPEVRSRMLIADTLILDEPEKEKMDIRMDIAIPNMDISVDTPLDVPVQSVNFNYTVNPRLYVGVAVPAPPVQRATDAAFGGLAGGDTVFGIHQLESLPRATYAPPPRYPNRARQIKREGVVKVRVILDTAGNVVTCSLVPGDAAEMFGEAALQAVKRWRFSPGKIGDRAVRCEVEIPIEFSLAK